MGWEGGMRACFKGACWLASNIHPETPPRCAPRAANPNLATPQLAPQHSSGQGVPFPGPSLPLLLAPATGASSRPEVFPQPPGLPAQGRG